MAEPQPPLSSLDTDEPHPLNPPPTNADDRKAAAALSSLDAHDEDESKENLQKANIDPEALGRAISWLEIRSGEKGQKEGAKGSGIDKGKDVDGEKKKIKLDQGDVTLLVEELELGKGKATDLLRTHDGDVILAMKAYVRASA